MIPALAVLVALACALASARRVWLVANATGLHPDVFCEVLRGSDANAQTLLERLRSRFENESNARAAPNTEWEHALLRALSAPPDLRAALVNEQLTELDYQVQRWGRVPRVCASISTSFGFLLATLVLRTALADTGDVPLEVPIELAEIVIRGLVGDALTVGAMGLVGTSFCLASQNEAKRLAKARLVAVDRLIERLEELQPANLAG